MDRECERKAESGVSSGESRRSFRQQQQLESDRPSDESPIDRSSAHPASLPPCPKYYQLLLSMPLSQILSFGVLLKLCEKYLMQGILTMDNTDQ